VPIRAADRMPTISRRTQPAELDGCITTVRAYRHALNLTMARPAQRHALARMRAAERKAMNMVGLDSISAAAALAAPSPRA